MEDKCHVKKHKSEKKFVAWLWHHHRDFPTPDCYQPIHDVQYQKQLRGVA